MKKKTAPHLFTHSVLFRIWHINEFNGLILSTTLCFEGKRRSYALIKAKNKSMKNIHGLVKPEK